MRSGLLCEKKRGWQQSQSQEPGRADPPVTNHAVHRVFFVSDRLKQEQEQSPDLLHARHEPGA
jgi:hypothetical protein